MNQSKAPQSNRPGNYDELYNKLVDIMERLYFEHNQDPARIGLVAGYTCQRKLLEHAIRQSRENINESHLFHNVVKCFVMVYPDSLAEVAIKFDMSLPSVNRWANSQSAPHPNMRELVLKFFEDYSKLR